MIFASQHCYLMTVESNCNSMSTKTVLIVSSNFEELTRKLLVLKQQMMNIKSHSCLVLEKINYILV